MTWPIDSQILQYQSEQSQGIRGSITYQVFDADAYHFLHLLKRYAHTERRSPSFFCTIWAHSTHDASTHESPFEYYRDLLGDGRSQVSD